MTTLNIPELLSTTSMIPGYIPSIFTIKEKQI